MEDGSRTGQKPKDVLILHRDVTMPGGVEKYFLKIRDKFTDNVDYFIIGRRPGEQAMISTILRLIGDYFRFASVLMKNQYRLVHLNPCLQSESFLREAIFHFLAKALGRKTLVFFRTWDPEFQSRIDRYPRLFRLLYGKADGFVVLSGESKQCLAAWGVKGPVFQEVAVADDNRLASFDMDKALEERESGDGMNIIFAARVTREKGIYELLEAMRILQERGSRAKLTVAGDSDELDRVKNQAAAMKLANVNFTGWLQRDQLDALLKKSGIFCLPTYYEGFPQAVVEAMAVGLPVVTRPVGGLKDFFRNGVHGFMSESKDPRVLAESLEKVINDPTLYRKISLNNYRFSQENFLASRAAGRLQGIYKSLLNGSIVVSDSPFVRQATI